MEYRSTLYKINAAKSCPISWAIMGLWNFGKLSLRFLGVSGQIFEFWYSVPWTVVAVGSLGISNPYSTTKSPSNSKLVQMGDTHFSNIRSRVIAIHCERRLELWTIPNNWRTNCPQTSHSHKKVSAILNHTCSMFIALSKLEEILGAVFNICWHN